MGRPAVGRFGGVGDPRRARVACFGGVGDPRRARVACFGGVGDPRRARVGCFGGVGDPRRARVGCFGGVGDPRRARVGCFGGVGDPRRARVGCFGGATICWASWSGPARRALVEKMPRGAIPQTLPTAQAGDCPEHVLSRACRLKFCVFGNRCLIGSEESDARVSGLNAVGTCTAAGCAARVRRSSLCPWRNAYSFVCVGIAC
jgi:hypothetical protein